MRTVWLAMIVLLVSIFTGCQMGDRTDDETGMRDPNVEQTRFHDDMNRTGDQGQQDNMQRRDRQGTSNMSGDDRRDNNRGNRNEQSYDVQEEAADRITQEIDDINYAYVLTTNRNAYVAAVLDRDENNTNTRDQSMTNQGTNRQQDRDRMTSNKDGNAQQNEGLTNDRMTNRDQTNNQGTNRGRDEGRELTDDVKNEIERIVKDVDPNIDNVYVSTNPDFADLTNNYINDFNSGKPVRGMFDQMGNMIERIFPQNRR